MEEIKPFAKIPLAKYFQHHLEKIKMAYRLSETIISDLKNIRASGDQVEFAVKDFLNEKLFPKYHVNDGHIIDENLKVSPQFDIIICENSKNPVLFNLADKSELFYYETVYCFGEVKKSFYKKNLIADFCKNLERSKKELLRDPIPPNFIETSNSGFYIEDKLTNLPLRNPIFTFMFFVNSSKLTDNDLSRNFKIKNNHKLPNITVFLDLGIIINVNAKKFRDGKININLYPEYECEENIWVMMNLQTENNVLTYFYMLLIEHLNSTTLGKQDIKKYTSKLFDFSISNFREL
ncbi:DUF6602 domain-containing protein [uncultured Chryseobacterium sp.]|uniref:DUF6602 domain-containing protein n=1 Tax=uncultured Chryseobacterium sp. TaxID=259322 RepID=UPI0025F10AC5|nr:DUF6602 domain-containing protein [uncultured Chryseobacterium sp.]